jgi:hypothetical protein
MRLLFATLARAAVLHERDEITIVRAFRRFVLRRLPEASALPECVIATEATRVRGYHFILIRHGRITFPSSMVLPQQMTFRLRLGARDVAARNLLLT